MVGKEVTSAGVIGLLSGLTGPGGSFLSHCSKRLTATIRDHKKRS